MKRLLRLLFDLSGVLLILFAFFAAWHFLQIPEVQRETLFVTAFIIALCGFARIIVFLSDREIKQLQEMHEQRRRARTTPKLKRVK